MAITACCCIDFTMPPAYTAHPFPLRLIKGNGLGNLTVQQYYVKNDIRKSAENQITIRIYQRYYNTNIEKYINYQNVQISFNLSLLKALFYTRCLNLLERLIKTIYIYFFF